MLEVLRVLLYILFTFSSLVLIVVILLQEGKGGGLAAAFGGAGGDTFGVGAGGINKFTSVLATVFILCAIVLAATTPSSVTDSLPSGGGDRTEDVAPEGGSSGTPPAESGTGGGTEGD